MTYRELVYMCLDEIKLSSDDSYITEDHILFLIGKYRSFLLKQKYEKSNIPISESNYQYLLLSPGDKVPAILALAKPIVELHLQIPGDTLFVKSTYVSHHRFEYVGNNSYLSKISYCTVNPYTHVLDFKINTEVDITPNDYKIYAIFDDIIEASKYTTETEEDILDKICPIETDLIAGVQELVVKDALGIAYRPQDKANNASDDLGSVGIASGNPKNNK